MQLKHFNSAIRYLDFTAKYNFDFLMSSTMEVMKICDGIVTHLRLHIFIEPKVLWIIFQISGLLCLGLGEEGADIWQIRNRDGELPPFPSVPDLRRRSINIADANEVLRLTLEQFLNVRNSSDLGVYLKSMRELPGPFRDEYGHIITSYKKVFLFISEQFDEFKTQNYAVGQYDRDKLHLCSVARYFSHQPSVKDRHTLMKRMSNALDYKCHPCTPYKFKEHGMLNDILVPDINYINAEGITPEESLLLCNNSNFNKTTNLVIGNQSFLESSSTTARPSIAIINSVKNETENRDGDLSSSPFSDKKKNATLRILQAHEILRSALRSYLDFIDTDLDIYLHRMIQRTENYVDEYGQIIHTYKKVLSFILQQYYEIKANNYAVGQFDKDKLDMCSVARFLSHQTTVENRRTLMKRMGDVLGYRCHPCTPYKRKEHDVTIIPETDNINPDGVSPEESLILCKDFGTVETTTPNLLLSTSGNTDQSFNDVSCENSKESVHCELVNIAEIKNFFSRNTTDDTLKQATLMIQPSENFIPEDIISNKIITEKIFIGYWKASTDDSSDDPIKLKVHPNAFRSTKNYTQKINLNYFDCSELNLDFLAGFEQLKNLSFWNVISIQHCLPTLPPFPNLVLLEFKQCSGLSEVASFPNLMNGLTSFGFSSIPLDKLSNDEAINKILNWIFISSSKTLQSLELEDHIYLTRVPNQISSFTVLNSLIIRRNNISIIKTGSLRFSVPVILLNLYGNGIKTIESGAIQGDFSNAVVFLDQNNLTRLEASVFKPLYLQSMAPGKNGLVFLRDNQFDCSDECHLAWVFRLRRSTQAESLKFSCLCFFGACSNGTYFGELYTNAFDRCSDEDEAFLIPPVAN